MISERLIRTGASIHAPWQIDDRDEKEL